MWANYYYQTAEHLGHSFQNDNMEISAWKDMQCFRFWEIFNKGQKCSYTSIEQPLFCMKWACISSSETQGQIVGATERLNGRENMARRKVKNGEKSPWGQCLTRPVSNGHHRSAFWLGRKIQTFSGTNQKVERRPPFGTGLVRHCP